MASTRGRCSAARLSESMIWSKCHCGSVCGTGFQIISSEKTALPSSDGRGFAVAGAEIEADAAAVPMASQRRGGCRGGGNVFGRDDLEGALVNAFAHDVGIEPAGGRFLEMAIQARAQGRRTVEIDAEAAAGPEQEFDQSFQI